jgi:hypothetical protein
MENVSIARIIDRDRQDGVMRFSQRENAPYLLALASICFICLGCRMCIT